MKYQVRSTTSFVVLKPGAFDSFTLLANSETLRVCNQGDQSGELSIRVVMTSGDVYNERVTVPADQCVAVTLKGPGQALLDNTGQTTLEIVFPDVRPQAEKSGLGGCVNTPFTFSGDESSGSLTGGTLCVNGGPIQVNGGPINQFLPDVSDIYAVTAPWYDPYSYEVVLVGYCPDQYSKVTYEFTDQSPDSYSLGIVSSSPSSHETSYDSPKPTIVSITWSAEQ